MKKRMNTFRKINSIALNAYQMIYNVVLLTLGIGAIGLFLYLLVMCSTPWNGIDHNDLIGLFVIGIIVGIVMIIVVPFLILLLVAMAGSIVSIIMLFISKKRSTGLIFALLNTFSIAFCAALCGFAAYSFTAIDILEGFAGSFMERNWFDTSFMHRYPLPGSGEKGKRIIKDRGLLPRML